MVGRDGGVGGVLGGVFFGAQGVMRSVVQRDGCDLIYNNYN